MVVFGKHSPVSFLLLAALLALAACGGTAPQFTSLPIQIVDGYFYYAKHEPGPAAPKSALPGGDSLWVQDISQKATFKMMDEAAFFSYFHPAFTMGNTPTKIDFDKQYVGAIVLPETNRATQIQLVSLGYSGQQLFVQYGVLADTVPQSYTTRPVLLFAVPSNLGLSRVQFSNSSGSFTVTGDIGRL